ncbi:MAG TPA: hypothetical protein PK108_15580 [Pyrinomonadaceae bacterium]|nr:hypothetical protein [Pyrinomonadaceae bacterium]
MQKRKFIIVAPLLVVLMMSLGALASMGQPSVAQLKKDLMGPKTVSITFGAPGTVAWSSTYKKYTWTRNFKAKVRTDTPGEFIIVEGYAAYDVVGGRYRFWRSFTSSNTYEGKSNPTIAEINQAFQTAQISEFNNGNSIIGEYESLRLAPDPDWEWHAPNSVSFNVVGVFRAIYFDGSYNGEPMHSSPSGYKAVDRIEAVRRIRLYRDGPNLPWSSVGVSNQIRNEAGYLVRSHKLLDRKEYRQEEIYTLPRMTRIPLLTQ